MMKSRAKLMEEGEPAELTLKGRVVVIARAVQVLGKLVMTGPGAYLSHNERRELNQLLFECLEVLNDEKEN